jgi:hypothetical protein
MNKKQSILKHKILHWKKLQIDTQTETFPYIVYTFILWQKIMIQCAIWAIITVLHVIFQNIIVKMTNM